MKLIGFLTSTRIAVRSIAWFATFLLLTVLWIMLLPFLSLDDLFQYFGNADMISAQSIAAISLAPPLVLSLLGWVGVQIMASVAAPAISSLDAAPVQSLSVDAATPQADMLRIAAWGVLTPFGDVSATLAGTQGQEKIFRPDNAIRNAEGHPVHTGLIEKLPLEMLNYPVGTRSRDMRVSAMLVTVLNALFDQQVELARSAVSTSVYWLIPEALSLDSETRLCFSIAWTHSFWCNVEYDLHLLSAASENAYSVVNALQQRMNQSKMPYALLLAADSLVDPDELFAPLALEQVFFNNAPAGFVPAEGAAGLLLADAAYARTANLVGLCTLGTAHREQRDTDRGAKGKIDSSILITCITDTLVATSTATDKIGSVISDSDHRFPRIAEVTQAMLQMLPDLDPLTDRISPMAYAGSFGAASDLIHIALAAEMAATTEQAALTVSVADVRRTAAMVIVLDAV